MAAQVRIVSIDYNPPGPDVAGEHVIIQNMSAATVDLTGWTIRDIASYRPHIYEFTGQQLAPGANVRIWTKSGANTATDLFWDRAAAIWNNPGDTAILLDQNKVEVSRFVSVPLPPGASPMRLAVPAFWSLDAQYQPYWSELKQAGSVLSIVVIDGSWPAAAKQNPPPYPTWKQDAEAMLDALPGAVLGYVSTRTSEAGPLRTADDILNNSVTTTGVVSVKDWYDEFGAHIDGIYFDELVLPGDPGSVTQEQDLISQFRGMHPNPAKIDDSCRSMSRRLGRRFPHRLGNSLGEPPGSGVQGSVLSREARKWRPVPSAVHTAMVEGPSQSPKDRARGA